MFQSNTVDFNIVFKQNAELLVILSTCLDM